MTADELFVVLADGLETRCDGSIPELEQVASYAFALAYVRVRGGGGWRLSRAANTSTSGAKPAACTPKRPTAPSPPQSPTASQQNATACPASLKESSRHSQPPLRKATVARPSKSGTPPSTF